MFEGSLLGIAYIARHFWLLRRHTRSHVTANRFPITLITLVKAFEWAASKYGNGPLSQFLGPFRTIALVNGEINVFETNLGHAKVVKVGRL